MQRIVFQLVITLFGRFESLLIQHLGHLISEGGPDIYRPGLRLVIEDESHRRVLIITVSFGSQLGGILRREPLASAYGSRPLRRDAGAQPAVGQLELTGVAVVARPTASRLSNEKWLGVSLQIGRERQGSGKGVTADDDEELPSLVDSLRTDNRV